MVALDAATGVRDTGALKPAQVKITGPAGLRAAAMVTEGVNNGGGGGIGADAGGSTTDPATAPAAAAAYDGNGGPVADGAPDTAVAMAVETTVNGHRSSQAEARMDGLLVGTNGNQITGATATGDDSPTGGHRQHAENGDAESALPHPGASLVMLPTPAGKVKAKEYGARDLSEDDDILCDVLIDNALGFQTHKMAENYSRIKVMPDELDAVMWQMGVDSDVDKVFSNFDIIVARIPSLASTNAVSTVPFPVVYTTLLDTSC